MYRDPVDLIVQWRRAEDGVDPEAADRAFVELARHWPRVSPPAGLADAVMRRVARGPAGARLWTLWWVRAAVAAAVLVAGGTLSWQPTPTAVLLGRSAWIGITGGIQWLMAAAAAWTETASAVARPLIKAAEVLGPALTAPGPALFCLVNVLLSAGALAVLRRVVVNREV